MLRYLAMFVCKSIFQSLDWEPISAIATFVMAIATFSSIYINKKQVDEMKRQWNESNKAILDFSIIIDRKYYILKIENIGAKTAYNVCIDVCDSFIDKMLIGELKNELSKLKTVKKTLPKNRKMYFLLSPIEHKNESKFLINGKEYTNDEINENLKYLLTEPIIIKGTYNESEKIDEYIIIESYAGYAKIPTALESGLKDISDEIHSISEKIRTKDVIQIGGVDDVQDLPEHIFPRKDKELR